MQDGESPAPYRPFEPFGRGGARGGTSGGGSSLESLEGLRVEVLGCSKREWVRRSCSSRSSRNSGGGGGSSSGLVGGSNWFWAFSIAVTLGERQVRLSRRYREFRALHEQLSTHKVALP